MIPDQASAKHDSNVDQSELCSSELLTCLITRGSNWNV